MENSNEPRPWDALTFRVVGGKSVVSFSEHHYALLPWLKWRREIGRPLVLISIDFHTDTNDAFQYYAHYVRDSDSLNLRPFYEQDRAARLAKLSIDNATSIEDAVLDLRHDEHIDAAIQCGILGAAFVLAHASRESLRPANASSHSKRNMTTLEHQQKYEKEPTPIYEIPLDRIILLGNDERMIGDDAYYQWRSRILETDHLRERLAHAAEICRSANEIDLIDAPFILDIDLDSFNTRQAIFPKDTSFFYSLIRKSYAITIAQEPECVDECQIDGEGLSSCWLEQQLISHIQQAML